MEKKDLSVIVVTYKTRDLLYKALGSVMTNLEHVHFSHEVIVIDNGSGDGTVEMLHEHFKNVVLIANSENKGLAHALNQGMKIARGRYLLNMDSDVEILNKAIMEMYRYLEEHPNISGVVTDEFTPEGKRKRFFLKGSRSSPIR